MWSRARPRLHSPARLGIRTAPAPALILAALLALAFRPVPAWRASPAAAAPHADAYELIDAVNALRASQGMAPLRVDPILMSNAQAQNDYSLSIGQVTHTGPDGSRPRERAYAAGYGGGATVFVSENIAQGTNLSPAEAVQWWTGDDPHWNTMMGPNYRDIGAGAGCDGDMCYYTIDTGYVAGALSANSTAPAAPAATGAAGGALPVLPATPLPDGSIVHTVQAGQTLWTVAAVYGISLAELLAQNGLTEDSLLHPGDELLIRAASEPGSTVSPSLTATSTSRAPTASPTARLTRTTEPLPMAAPPEASADMTIALSPMQWMLGAVGLALLAVGIVFAVRHRSPPEPPLPPSGIDRVFGEPPDGDR